MKYNLHSEHIKKRLFFSIVVIVCSIFFITVPLTLNSYEAYEKSKDTLSKIIILKSLTDISNLVSEERAPTNIVLSSRPEVLEKNIKKLDEHREQLNKKVNETIILLKREHYFQLAEELENNFKKVLKGGRNSVDEYTHLAPFQRSSEKLDHVIQRMYIAWDVIRSVSASFIINTVKKSSDISNHYTIILLLTDLRDQVGRIASNIIAPLTFNEKIPDRNEIKSLQAQYQAKYLWELISTLQSEEVKTNKYLDLHQQVQVEFMAEGLPLIENLIEDSNQNVPYSLTATQLTDKLIGKYSTVINLQTYLIDNFILHIKEENKEAFREFLLSIMVSLVSLTMAVFTLIYARNRIFRPLIEARQKILMLANNNNEKDSQEYGDSSISLFEAIQQLQNRLQQRDILEFQLHNIANTDALTGVSNRLALEQYIMILESHTGKLINTGLIVFDIDDFKKVNDKYGHATGDQVIKFIADKLKANLRTTDVIVRYGGDEFIVILDSINNQDTLLVADKIRRDISESEMIVLGTNEVLQVSISAGIAVGATTWKELFERADKALLKVKIKGKNAVSE